jgi:molybdate-binding protein
MPNEYYNRYTILENIFKLALIMQNIIHSQSEEVFRALSDSTRVSILRKLLLTPSTITQLGKALGSHPARIKYHINQLEKVGLVELAFKKTIKNYQEKYYRTTSKAVFLNRAIFPWPSEKGQVVILGGDGPALDLLVSQVNSSIGTDVFLSIPAGSLDSLIYLRENYCQIAGCHLLDFKTGDFNISFIRHIFAFKDMVVITFGNRDQGLMLPKGNPNNISNLSEVVQKKLRFVNRPLGAGTRLRLDQLLSEAAINPQNLIGYDVEVQTHNEVGEYILQGKADVGLGLASVARQMDLDFKFIFTERYDLVMSLQTFHAPLISELLHTLKSKKTRAQIEKLGGYDLTNAGNVTYI